MKRLTCISLLATVALLLGAVRSATAEDVYFVDRPSNDIVATGEPDVVHSSRKAYEIPYGPVKQIDPDEFRRRYGKYFDKEYQEQQQIVLRDRTDADRWRRSPITAQEGLFGTLFIDDEGKVALAAHYPVVYTFSEGLAVVGTTVSDDAQLRIGGYGFIDQTGRLVIPGIYEEAGRFSDGLAPVRKDGKCGYIDRRGKVVVDFQYRFAESFKDGIARASLDRDNIDHSVEFIDKTGQVLFRARGDSVGRFSEGLAYANLPAEKPAEPMADVVAPERVRGYLDRRFEFAVRFTPELPGGGEILGGEEFHEGMAAVTIGHSSGERKGFISRDGKLVFEDRFRQVQPFSEGLAAVRVTSQEEQESAISERWGFVDKTGKMVIEPQYLSATGFHEGKAAVVVELEESSAKRPRGRWGFIDKQGKQIIKPRFYRATEFENGLARVQDNPYSHGYINDSGEYVWRLDEPSYGYDRSRP